MAVITLISDWKRGDYYDGMLRGDLLCAAVAAGLTHSLHVISNRVKPFDVQMGVFLLRRTFAHFPLGTIHILAVQAQATDLLPMALAYYQGHYFISVNDGRFSLLFDSPPQWIRALYAPTGTFSERECYVKGVRAVTEDKLEELTLPAAMKTEARQGAVSQNHCIIGQVVYVDSYGNAITNISRMLFDRVGEGRPFVIYVQGPYTKITSLSSQYGGVRPGELQALFNSANLLEIAIFLGNLAKQENLSLYAEIQIQFQK